MLFAINGSQRTAGIKVKSFVSRSKKNRRKAAAQPMQCGLESACRIGFIAIEAKLPGRRKNLALPSCDRIWVMGSLGCQCKIHRPICCLDQLASAGTSVFPSRNCPTISAGRFNSWTPLGAEECVCRL